MKQRNVVTKAGAPTNISQPVMQEQEPAEHAPTVEEIRKRAFEIHVECGGIHGFDLDDWLQAERELKKKYEPSAKSNKRIELKNPSLS